MNRNDVAKLLEASGVSSTTYCVDGSARDEAYILEQDGRSWSVYYSERGLRTALAWFDSEADACKDMLARVLDDPTTRKRLSPGAP